MQGCDKAKRIDDTDQLCWRNENGCLFVQKFTKIPVRSPALTPKCDSIIYRACWGFQCYINFSPIENGNISFKISLKILQTDFTLLNV